VIDRFVDWCIKNILRVRDPAADPNRKPVEPEDIPWDVPLDETKGRIYTLGDPF
jgi:hypothetical protein